MHHRNCCFSYQKLCPAEELLKAKNKSSKPEAKPNNINTFLLGLVASCQRKRQRWGLVGRLDTRFRASSLLDPY